MPRRTGITASTPQRVIVDAGALYRNYGTAQQQLIGATRGGSTFTVEREDRDIEMDGKRGSVMGLKRTITHTARLETTLVEISEATLLDVTRGTSAAVAAEPQPDGAVVGQRRIIPGGDIILDDYQDNIALVADMANTTTPIVIMLLNALQDGEWSLTVDDQNEGELSLTYMGHYDAADMDTPPYKILFPTTAV